jgi:hypothetical protein
MLGGMILGSVFSTASLVYKSQHPGGLAERPVGGESEGGEK